MTRSVQRSLLILAAILISAGMLQAAETVDLSSSDERHIGGHGFMPSRYINDPFIGTYYESFVGGATAPTFERDFRDADGTVLFTLKGSLVYASLGMAFQQQIGQKWAFGLGGSALIRSGTNAVSFIEDGANVNTNGGVWAKRLISRSEKSQLTAGLNWGYVSTTLFTPREFADHIRDGGALVDAPLVQNRKNWNAGVDLMWAHAFNPTYAIRLSGTLGVSEKQNNSSVVIGANNVGFLAEVDFKDKHGLPLGISLGHFIAFPENHVESGPSGTVLGFWYTGKQDFAIGLETGWISISVSDDSEEANGAFGILNVKYYF